MSFEDYIHQYICENISLQEFLTYSNLYIQEQLCNKESFSFEDYIWSAFTLYYDGNIQTSDIYVKNTNHYEIINEYSKKLNEGIIKNEFGSFTTFALQAGKIGQRKISIDGRFLIENIYTSESADSFFEDKNIFINSNDLKQDAPRTIKKLIDHISFPLSEENIFKLKPFFAIYRDIALRVSRYENDDALYFYILPDSLYANKLQSLFFICIKKNYENQFIKLFYDRILLYIDKVVSAIYIKRLFKEEEYAKLQSIKSAKAAIMSRNMSHNLGSHVMAYLKQNLGSVIDIVKGNVIEKIVSNNQLNNQIELWKNYFSNEIGNSKKNENGNKYRNQIELPFLVGIGHFISYIQERQDYIATVSTDYVPYFSSINFKDDIYDVLNPDLRYLRHTDRIGGRPENILLSFIARSEGLQRPSFANTLTYSEPTVSLKNTTEFETLKSCCMKKRENDIVIKFRNFDGLNDSQLIPLTIKCGDKSTDIFKRNNDSSDEKNEKDLNTMRTLNLSLPGGIAGRQAIFSIIENIIRNAAKHGDWENTTEKRLELVFDIFDCSVEGTSHNPALQKELKSKGYFDQNDSRDLYILTITDNIPIDENKIKQLKEAINQDYIYDDGSMINENKGIKEIKISASWLRNLTHQEEEVGMAPILNIRSEAGHLQYIICVPKVKKYAVICSNPESFKGKGGQAIYYYTAESYIKERNKSFNIIAILDEDKNCEYEKIKNTLIPISPNHIVKINSDDLEALQAESALLPNDKLAEEFQKRIDAIYNRMYGIDNNSKIIIIDNKVGTYADSIGYENEKEKVECWLGEKEISFSYAYLTHLETEKNFYEFLHSYILGKEKINIKFAEGISGGNSTDRLVRGINCNFNSEWYYKHMNAMRKNVAIFDERLFSKMTNLKDNELTISDFSFFNKIEKNAQEIPDEILTSEEWQKLEKAGMEIPKDCTYQILHQYLGEEIKEKIGIEIYSKNYLIAVNYYKNIHIYTFIYNNSENTFDIYGYTGCETIDNQIKFKINKVGTISKINEQPIKIEFNNSGSDYLSIHQGLLDKIYHQWNITGNDKCNITQAFYEQIMGKENSIDFGNDGYKYLPGLIIHSGRAKPSDVDMPQKQPFIQYASLDHAISDCKYTLIELLDNARYE